MRTKILGIGIDVITKSDTLKIILSMLYSEARENKLIVTPNPEMIVKAQKDKEFMKILCLADIVIPDGIGIVIASKLNEIKLKERVAGCDIILSILENVDREIKVYILGANETRLLKAKINIEKKYKNINVVGYHNGYFKEEEEELILKEIINKKPDILIVGLGFPKQEKWMYKNKSILPVKVSVAIGGTIDIISGEVKRAPQIFIKFGLEWLYRLIKEPKRIFRIIVIPKFVFMVIYRKIFKLNRIEGDLK